MEPQVLVPKMATNIVKDNLAKHHVKMIETSNEQPVDEILKKGKQASGIMLITTPMTKEVIDKLPNLKVIARIGIGYDNVDYKYAASKGIWVTNTPGANAVAVSEATVADMLILSKRSYSISKAMRNGNKTDLPTTELHHKTIGIVGYGHIGQNVAKILSSFGVNILIWNRHQKTSQYGKFVDWDTLFRNSDYISLHVPSTPDTYHSVSENEFKMMKKSAFIVNFARGSVIDQKVMINALKSGEIAGAGLDVFEKEPLPMDSELRKLPNVYLTPHNAGNSVEAINKMATTASSEVLRGINGQKPNSPINEAYFK